jgi:hypothetical protein
MSSNWLSVVLGGVFRARLQRIRASHAACVCQRAHAPRRKPESAFHPRAHIL